MIQPRVNEMHKAMAIAVLRGATYAAVGHDCGRTRERVRQAVWKVVKLVDPENPYLHNDQLYRPTKNSATPVAALRKDAERLIGLIQSLDTTPFSVDTGGRGRL